MFVFLLTGDLGTGDLDMGDFGIGVVLRLVVGVTDLCLLRVVCLR
jgi:hypothetical protein